MEFGGEIISPADFETDVYRMRSIWQVGEGVYLALREDDPEPNIVARNQRVARAAAG